MRPPASPAAASRAVGVWLLVCCLLLTLLILVGGLTRLTRSGLSITEWQPILGALPPLHAAAWAETFAKYQQTSEYLRVNRGMTLAEFKGIFWWEYAHRSLARALALAFFVPLVVFLLRRRIARALAARLVGVLLLGAAQGAMGWFMVQSGLGDEPRVSPLRLAAHLGMAFAILAALYWLALDQLAIRRGAPAPRPAGGRRSEALAVGIAWLVFLQVVVGGLVAGSHASLIHNTFPLMSGALLPPGLWVLEPGSANLLYNLTTIQFSHRLCAWTLLALVAVFAWRVHAAPRDRALARAANLLLATVVAQFLLGVATLLTHVPLAFAIAHQGGAIVLFAAALFAAHTARGERAPTLRSPAQPGWAHLGIGGGWRRPFG